VARWRTPRPVLALALHPSGERLVAVTDGQLTTFPLDTTQADPAGLDLPYTEPLVIAPPDVQAAECAC